MAPSTRAMIVNRQDTVMDSIEVPIKTEPTIKIEEASPPPHIKAEPVSPEPTIKVEEVFQPTITKHQRADGRPPIILRLKKFKTDRSATACRISKPTIKPGRKEQLRQLVEGVRQLQADLDAYEARRRRSAAEKKAKAVKAWRSEKAKEQAEQARIEKQKKYQVKVARGALDMLESAKHEKMAQELARRETGERVSNRERIVTWRDSLVYGMH